MHLCPFHLRSRSPESGPTLLPMATHGRPRSYSADQKAEALRLYRKVGAAEAARRLGGIPPGVVRQWAHRAGLARERVVQGRTHAEALRLSWAQRRADLRDQAGEVAAEALQAVRTEPDPQAKKALTVTFAILVDKALLISGEATSRTETLSPEQARAEVRQLRDDLAARRSAKAS
jgi:transposase-like protein